MAEKIKEMLDTINRLEDRLNIIMERVNRILEILTLAPEKPKATTEKPLVEKSKKPNFIVVKKIEDYISKAGTNLSYKLTNGAGQNCYIAKIHVESINEDNTKLTVISGKEWTLDKLEWK